MVKLNCFALSTVLLTIFIPQLLKLNYSILSFEIGFFTFTSIMLGFSIGYVARNRFVLGPILGFCIYFFLDIYFLQSYYAPTALIICIFGVPLLLRFFAVHLPLAVFLFSISFIMPDVFQTQVPMLYDDDTRRAAVTTIEKPDVAYIHLILDEQMSPLVAPEQMPDDFTPQDFFDPYLRNGFKVYGLANANSKSTFSSVSGIVGFTNSTENYVWEGPLADFSYAPKNNTLVQNLVDHGFSTTVIQSTFIYLCGEDQALNCRTYSRAIDLSIVETLGLPLSRRLQLAFISLHDDFVFGVHSAYVYQQIMVIRNNLMSLPRPKRHGYFTLPLVSASILRNIEEQAAAIEPGQALVAHLLLPHFPYVVDENCELKDTPDWGYPVRNDYYDDAAKAYETFWDQSICASNLIAKILDHVGDRDDVVIFVHGDHGGRILFETDLENDADTLGTFLAVKSPNLSAGLNRSPVSLQDTYKQEFMSAVGMQPAQN